MKQVHREVQLKRHPQVHLSYILNKKRKQVNSKQPRTHLVQLEFRGIRNEEFYQDLQKHILDWASWLLDVGAGERLDVRYRFVRQNRLRV